MQASHFHKYKFISPTQLFALVKEEFKSYFDSGAIDDTLFPLWTERCLDKLGVATYPIYMTLLNVDNHVANLPHDFVQAREAWYCTELTEIIPDASSTYTQVTSEQTVVADFADKCEVSCDPPLVKAVIKTTNKTIATYRQQHRLRPGNIAIYSTCDIGCSSTGVMGADVYDIDENGRHLITNLTNGVVFLVYYAEQRDERGFRVIPDSVKITDYLYAYLKFKIYEQLFNQSSDESFQQLRYKTEKHDQEQSINFIAAESEIKKETVYQKAEKIKKNQSRNSGYNIS